jgi:PAS domain S-box-containing protein
MHPIESELNGDVLDDPEYNCALGGKENLFKAFVDVGLEKGEGFVDYCWPKPIPGGVTEKRAKLSFVRLFKPWGWIVGTGVYIDDVERDAQDRLQAVIKDLNQGINQQRIGENGYFSIIDETNRILVHPNRVGIDGSHLINPSTGNPMLDDIKKAAFRPGNSLEYLWDKPDHKGEFRFPKRAFVTYYEPLGWYIHSTIYVEDFEKITSRLTRSLVMFSATFLALALLLSLFVFRGITRPLNLLIRSISRTDRDGIPTGPLPSKGTLEIQALSVTINNMLFTIRESRKTIKAERDLSLGIIEGAPSIIAGIDLDGRTTFINPAAEQTTGYRKEEIIDQVWWELFNSERSQQAIVKAMFEQSVKTSILNYEMDITCKNGEQKQIVWSSFAKRDAHHDPHEVFWFGNDVSERKLAEKNLQNLRNYLLGIINSMPSVLVGVDAEGAITQWNTEAERYTGISPKEALGKPLEKTFPRLAPEMERIQAAMHGNEIVTDTRQSLQKNNDVCYEDITIFPLVAGNEEGAVIRIDNVTDKVRMEEMMIQSEKMLSVGGLAAGMAHEINNPLAGMMQTASVMASRLVEDSHLPVNRKAASAAGTTMESIREYMEARGIPSMISNIKESGQRVATIINNMLDFARKNGDQVSSRSLTELIDKTLELAVSDYDLKKQYDFRLIEIVKVYEENLPPVPCEAAKIQQVLLNLLRNGAQSMQAAGIEQPQFIIRAGLERRRKMIRLELQDNGPGVDERYLSRIFEPFFTTKPAGEGTGLGLSVSYFIIVENHGGEMTVESQPGSGATFTIRLPLGGKQH